MTIGIADIEAARERIAGRVRRTPVIALAQLKSPPAIDARVTLKLESLQVTGSFKARGAMNRLLSTPKEELRAGIVTASGGNHGLAVARTAYVAGVPAAIYVPSNVSPAKVAKMKQWGAKVEIVGDVFDQSNAAALDYASEDRRGLFPSLRRPAGGGRAGDARPRDPRRPAGRRRFARRDRRRRTDLGSLHRDPRPASGGQDHRRRADRIADAEGEPRRRPRGDAREGHHARADDVVPADGRLHLRHRARRTSTTSCWSPTRRWRRRRAGCGSRWASPPISPAPPRWRRSARRRHRSAAPAHICVLVCGAGAEGTG